MDRTYTPADVTVRDIDPIPVTIMEHRGDPALIGDTVQRFIAWRKAHGLPPAASRTFNIFYSNPHTTPPAQYRLGLCVGTDTAPGPFGKGMRHDHIPGGRYAVLRCVGDEHALDRAIVYLCRDWLPASGEQMEHVPPFCERVRFFPHVPAKDAVTDFFLPLQSR
ncbi:MAG: GyrI-like domain-containing protein [Acetobacter sp.]|uniref:AraC family transcriptional regulator n=1 Tax=Acetobacter sp. TaxID=440 RepID=UPI0039EADF1B